MDVKHALAGPICGVAVAPDGSAVAAAAEPKQQEIQDFGVVRHQKILSHDFFLANAGDQEASCTLVRKSCECLKADLPAKIPAGQRGK